VRFGRCGLVRWSRLLFVALGERVQMTMGQWRGVFVKGRLSIAMFVLSKVWAGSQCISPTLFFPRESCHRRGGFAVSTVCESAHYSPPFAPLFRSMRPCG
jgi:hypothetical protein